MKCAAMRGATVVMHVTYSCIHCAVIISKHLMLGPHMEHGRATHLEGALVWRSGEGTDIHCPSRSSEFHLLPQTKFG